MATRDQGSREAPGAARLSGVSLVHPPPRGRPRIEGITTRELGILAAMGDGLSNEEIGAEFHLAAQTVKWHRQRIYEKLGARNAANAVALAYHRGLLLPRA